MDLKEIGINTRNWFHSAKDKDYWRALVNAAFDLRVPQAMDLIIYTCQFSRQSNFDFCFTRSAFFNAWFIENHLPLPCCAAFKLMKIQ